LRTYEALYIVQHETSEDDAQTIAQEVDELITENGGAIVRSEIWGKRRLAFQVNGQIEGIYVLVRFEADPGFNLKLESHFRLHESIVRFLVILFDEKTLRLEAEQQRRNEALLAAQTERGGRGGDDDDDVVPRRRREPEAAVEA
jgi:small subunit ribosomal protein S6